MKKKIVAVALTSVLCLSGASLVACGGSSSSTNNASNNTTNTAATTTNNTANTTNTATNNTSNSSSGTLGGNTSSSASSGISESEAKDAAVNFLRQILSNKAHDADVSQSTYEITGTTGSSSEGYTFTGNGTLCDSSGNALSHGASYSFEIKVTPDGNTDLRNFDRS